VIELGEVSSGQVEPEPPPERPFRMRDVRWFAVVAVLVVCVLGVTGSAVPEPRGLRTLWTMPVESQPFMLVGDTLYVHRAGEQPALEAYEAATGRLRWRHPLERPTDWVHTEVPGIVMLPVVSEQADGSSMVTSVTALDERTGRELWRQPGEPAFGDRSGLMMIEWNPRFSLLTRLRLIRPADGAEVWSFTPPKQVASWTASVPGAGLPEWFATVSEGGRVEVRRTADNALLRTGTMPWNEPDPNDQSGDYAYLGGVAGRLLSVQQQAGTQVIQAYDIATLRPTWSWSGDGRGGTFDCGRLICVGDLPGVQAIDPDTGAKVWSSAGWDYARPLSGQRMIFESHRDTNQGLLDSATGEILATFPRGMVVVDADRGDAVLLSFTSTMPFKTAVYHLHGDALELRGEMGDATNQGCQLANSRLVCLLGSGSDQRLMIKAVG
jgi:outer membrane protein assembly factor BamB